MWSLSGSLGHGHFVKVFTEEMGFLMIRGTAP